MIIVRYVGLCELTIKQACTEYVEDD